MDSGFLKNQSTHNGEHNSMSNTTDYHQFIDNEEGWVDRRTDILHRVNGQLKLAKRKIILDQNIFMNKSLNVFL